VEALVIEISSLQQNKKISILHTRCLTMNIQVKKLTAYQCEYMITRENNSVERITLETKTYLLHDICHYVVEKNLGYSKGFWGMLSQGYSFGELLGKNNPLTTELRFIEQVVGPVQATFMGHIPQQDFNLFVKHIDVTLTESILTTCLTEIKNILNTWEQLLVGQYITLEWNKQTFTL
jgi:hypothetical protein